jgi:hypothetical protein
MWIAYSANAIFLDLWNQISETHIHAQGECWDRIAKWPNGEPFPEYDATFDFEHRKPYAPDWNPPDSLEQAVTRERAPTSTDPNKPWGDTVRDWTPEGAEAIQRWMSIALQKVKDCETAAPFFQRAFLRSSDFGQAIRSGLAKTSLSEVLLPPLILLLSGLAIRWVIRGFSPGT